MCLAFGGLQGVPFRQEGPEQRYGAQLHSTYQSLPWVQGGGAGPGSPGAGGEGSQERIPRNQQIPDARTQVLSWDHPGVNRPQGRGMLGNQIGQGSPAYPGLKAGGRQWGYPGWGSRMSKVGPGTAPHYQHLEMSCLGDRFGFSAEPELAQSRRLAGARLPADPAAPGRPPPRQTKKGRQLFIRLLPGTGGRVVGCGGAASHRRAGTARRGTACTPQQRAGAGGEQRGRCQGSNLRPGAGGVPGACLCKRRPPRRARNGAQWGPSPARCPPRPARRSRAGAAAAVAAERWRGAAGPRRGAEPRRPPHSPAAAGTPAEVRAAAGGGADAQRGGRPGKTFLGSELARVGPPRCNLPVNRAGGAWAGAGGVVLGPHRRAAGGTGCAGDPRSPPRSRLIPRRGDPAGAPAPGNRGWAGAPRSRSGRGDCRRGRGLVGSSRGTEVLAGLGGERVPEDTHTPENARHPGAGCRSPPRWDAEPRWDGEPRQDPAPRLAGAARRTPGRGAQGTGGAPWGQARRSRAQSCAKLFPGCAGPRWTFCVIVLCYFVPPYFPPSSY